MKHHFFYGCLCLAAVILKVSAEPRGDGSASEESRRNHVPQPGAFALAGAGVLFHGDLVMMDAFNRRGALRNGDGATDPRRRYFAMLPYGMVRVHGAPADVRDLPMGTHLHARLLLPLKGEEDTIPPPTEKQIKRNPDAGHNHAVLL
ncbi:MAG: hypothetical protein P1U82_13690 [Verrucomicrobiales bacterium]|jgi:hypothetical protein|nr:hypothetical protein [Verrucomicrobiales bacterium]MDF1786916.1 hypothetical protein [Verrucomicrobiales bacterium]